MKTDKVETCPYHPNIPAAGVIFLDQNQKQWKCCQKGEIVYNADSLYSIFTKAHQEESQKRTKAIRKANQMQKNLAKGRKQFGQGENKEIFEEAKRLIQSDIAKSNQYANKLLDEIQLKQRHIRYFKELQEQKNNNLMKCKITLSNQKGLKSFIQSYCFFLKISNEEISKLEKKQVKLGRIHKQSLLHKTEHIWHNEKTPSS